MTDHLDTRVITKEKIESFPDNRLIVGNKY